MFQCFFIICLLIFQLIDTERHKKSSNQCVNTPYQTCVYGIRIICVKIILQFNIALKLNIFTISIISDDELKVRFRLRNYYPHTRNANFKPLTKITFASS